jgi:hypothetical protein
MNETGNSLLTSGTVSSWSGYVDNLTTPTGVFTIPYGTVPSWGITSNQNNMSKQVRVAVFTVERNEDNKVTSSKFVKELWVEVKNGASIDLAVAKQLDKDFDPSTTVIKEINSVTF